MKAIILAGGLGERLKPLTNTTPKPLLPIKNKPILEYAIKNLKKNNITDIILGISFHADKVKNYFKNGSKFGVNITYSVEKEPLGTGGAVKLATKNLKEPFILIWGDNIANFNFTEMIKEHKKNKATLTMALTLREDVENFGVADLNNKQKIIRFIEKPKRDQAPSRLINAGAFIVEPEALNILPDGKSNIERECFEKLCGEQGKVYAFQHNGYWFPTDTLEKYKKAEKELTEWDI
jgi:NDP-sugar pyrophosphorylase family protein